MMLKDKIKKMASEIKDDVVIKRRHLHQNPELSFVEFNTSAFIKKSLDELGIPWIPVANTGVLATIKGQYNSNLVIALRADMDALPIVEKTSVTYKSLNEGVMHACGHDVHISSLLGVAEILKRLDGGFLGTVELLFQPAEEVLPGGAIKVIEEKVFECPKINAIVGQHAMPSIPVGKIGIRKGNFMASMDEISIRIKGRGGHGAVPHKNIDPVVAASTIVVTLQQIVSRYNNPGTPTVLSFGKFQANGAFNIIPDEVLLEGTFRTFDENWKREAHNKIRSIVRNISEGLDCESVINIKNGYPHLSNNIHLLEKIKEFMNDYLGSENVIDVPIWMASDDFAYYTEKTDALFYLLGVGHEGIENPLLHTSFLDINEDSIELSMGLMAYIALKYLDNR